MASPARPVSGLGSPPPQQCGGGAPLLPDLECPMLELEDVAPYVAQAGHRALADVLARVNRFLWCDERIARAISRVGLGLHRRTRLAHAARVGDVGRVAFLVEHGASVSARDGWGRSALTEAVAGGHAGVAGWLRAHGAEEDVVWEGVDVTAAGEWGPWVSGMGGGRVAAGARDPVFSLAVVSGGEVAVGHESGAIIMRNLATGGARATLVGHTSGVNALVSLPCGRLVSGSEDGSVRVWRVDTGVCERTLALVGHTDGVSSLVVLLSGLLVSGSADRTARLWDSTTGVCPATLEHTSMVCSLAALPCGGVACGCGDGSIVLWSAGGVRMGTLGGGADYKGVMSLTRLQDGRLAAGYEDGCIRVWDVAGGELDARLIGHASIVWSLTVLPDGRLLSGSGDHTIRVWGEGALSVRGGGDTAVCAATLEGHTGWVWALVVLRDGAVASGSGSRDGSVRLWK